MRFLAGFALVLLGVAFAQSQLVVPQFDNLNGIIALIPQAQGFLELLDTILPQLAGVLSQTELQSLKEKIFQVVLGHLGGNLDINTIKDKIRPILEQFLSSKPLGRVDFNQILQGIAGAAASQLPGLLLSLLGKRDATEARAGLEDILALADKLQLNTLIPQISQFLNAAQLQQLQNQILGTVITGLGNNWNIGNVAQALQQLVSGFVPQVAQMRIDWDAVAQSALNGLTNALPGLLIGALGLFGKRGLAANYQQLLAQLPVDKLAQLVAVVNNVDKSQVFATLRKLLQQFFPAYQGRINFDELAANVLAHLNSLLPTLSSSLFSQILG